MQVLTPDGRIKGEDSGLTTVGASMFRTANQTVTTGNPILFDGIVTCPPGWYDPATGRFTPKLPGRYGVSWCVRDTNVPVWSQSSLAKNGTIVADGTFQLSGWNPGSSHGEAAVYCNGTTDYISILHNRSDATGATILGGTGKDTYINIDLAGVAVGILPEPWHIIGAAGEPAFQSSWVQYDTGTTDRRPRFRKDPNGNVQATGLIKNGTVGLVAFNLPVGYRIGGGAGLNQHYPCVSNGAAALAYWQINPNGDVVPQGGSNVWFDLSGIRYAAEQ